MLTLFYLVFPSVCELLFMVVMSESASRRNLEPASASSVPTRTLAGILQVEDAAHKSIGERRIYTKTEIIIGRDQSRCQFVIDDPYISKKHLRIYTVVYDGDDFTEPTALVYAEDLSRNGVYWNASLIGRGNGGYLLSEGDLLKLSPKSFLRFEQCEQGRAEPEFDLAHESELASFSDEYNLTDRVLGAGAFGRVYMAIKQSTRAQVACKLVDLRKLEPQAHTVIGRYEQPAAAEDVNVRLQTKKVREWMNKQKRDDTLEFKLSIYYREIDILSSINHPNIISIEKAIVTDNSIYIFQELITGGDLFSYLQSKNGKLLEVEAAVIVRQIVIALCFLHDQNIVHRDLKPENILMTSSAVGCRVVLTDFGAARRIKEGQQRLLTEVGTVQYTAPEIYDRKAALKNNTSLGYTKSIDMWALGCIVVVLLTGGHAFDDPATHVYSNKLARECNLDFLRASNEWQTLRNRPKDFVEKLLVLEEDARLTAPEALKHYWFSNEMHRTDFEDLYQRTIKHWRPSQQKVATIEFVNSSTIKYLPCSQAVAEKSRNIRNREQAPVEPPYRPFPRKFNLAFWPRKKPGSRLLSPEIQTAIRRNWSQDRSSLRTPLEGIRGLTRSFLPRRSLPLPTSSVRQIPSFSSLFQHKSGSNSIHPGTRPKASFRLPYTSPLNVTKGSEPSAVTDSVCIDVTTKSPTCARTATSHETEEDLGIGAPDGNTHPINDVITTTTTTPVFEAQHRADAEIGIVVAQSHNRNTISSTSHKSLRRRIPSQSTVVANQSRKRRRGSIFDIEEEDNYQNLGQVFHEPKRQRSSASSIHLNSGLEVREDRASDAEVTQPHHASAIVKYEREFDSAQLYLPR